jgi:hypothetical protein
MTRLWHVLPLALAVSALAPPAVSAPKPSTHALTQKQQLVVQVALARALPASLSAAQRALLTTTKKQLAAGETAKAKASYKKFLKAEGSDQLTSSELELVERWLAREAALIAHKELDAAAYKLGKSEQAIAALGAHRAKLVAIGAKPATKGKWTIEIVTVESGEIVSKGKRTVTRAGLGDAIKVLDAKQEEIRNEREMATEAFQNFDQKANQTMNLLSAILKAMAEMRLGAAKSML